jgi:hypothetical protein
MIYTNVTSGGDVSKKDAGRNVINALINIVPYSEDPENQ